ncbi:3'-5' exonuclease [Pedobacter miscanthi]|uniref:3'-5' exonuclease n=1 Tax=Pedobacter miscanthi TaxID=2259170 RepID=UPI002931C91C|nr:3'-5' exonuclease [Pedobacter miscanthi]
MQEYFLVVDTETSGLPKNWSAPYTNEKNWPHILQIAWIIYDPQHREIKRENHFISSAGVKIDKEALKIHHITSEYLQFHGEDKEKVMLQFAEDIEQYKPLVIGHFIELDYHMINVELHRIGRENIFKNLVFFCTMKASSPYITNTVISHLKLDKFYTVLFNEIPENVHNALSDALNTAKIFFHLLETGKISLTSTYHQEHTFNQEKKKTFSFKSILQAIFNGR